MLEIVTESTTGTEEEESPNLVRYKSTDQHHKTPAHAHSKATSSSTSASGKQSTSMATSVSHSSSGYQSLYQSTSFDLMSNPTMSNSSSFAEAATTSGQDKVHQQIGQIVPELPVFVQSLHRSLAESMKFKQSKGGGKPEGESSIQMTQVLPPPHLLARRRKESLAATSSTLHRTKSLDRKHRTAWMPDIQEAIREVPGSPAVMAQANTKKTVAEKTSEDDDEDYQYAYTTSSHQRNISQDNPSANAKNKLNHFDENHQSKPKRTSFISTLLHGRTRRRRPKSRGNKPNQERTLCMYVFGGREEERSSCSVHNKQSMTIWKLYI